MHDEIRNAAARRITEEAAQWMIANREGLDEPSRVAFMAWLRHSPAHVGEYMAIMQWDQDVREAAGRETLDAEALVALAGDEPAVVPFPARSVGVARERIARKRAPTGGRGGSRRSKRRWLWSAGAMAVVLLAGAVVWPRNEAPPAGIVYAAPTGATRSLELEDGSRVQLDRGSAIRVNFSAGKRDIAVVAGTMLIDVGHANAAPLSVTLGRTVLRDIGTVFQVSAKDDGGDVTVLSGQVDVMAQDASWPWQTGTAPQRMVTQLKGGQRATLDEHGGLTEVTPGIDVSKDLAWLPAEIDFHDAPIADVARRFNAYGQAPFVIEDETIARTRISGRFHGHDPAGFVAYLQTLPGVQVRRESDGLHVARKPASTRPTRL
ncbi:FecR family protein [Luteibacter sp.]|uniref:FecR family protein n=1 Tax=Luteibacter sp. TaxID=1886636 RepID=UPI003F8177CB